MLATVRAAGGRLLARAEVFDVYRGEQVAQGRNSLALALTFRAQDRTLTDEDVAPVREKIVARLRTSWAVSCVADTRVARRRGLGLRGRARRAADRPPPALRAGRGHEPQRRRAGALTDLYPHHRVTP